MEHVRRIKASTVRLTTRTRRMEDVRIDTPLTPAIFLDRDGTIIEEANYISRPEDVRLIPGARDGLQRLREAGYKLIIITNQSGIGRGYFTESEFQQVQAELQRQLGDVQIDATYFCPAAPDEGSPRRKPSPIMVFEALKDLSIDQDTSYFVGDKKTDIECGKRAGLMTILVQTGYGIAEQGAPADMVARDLGHAAELILEKRNA